MQTNLAVQVARAVGSPGSAVLIFVPGMAAILEIMNLFELISSADVTYKVRWAASGKDCAAGGQGAGCVDAMLQKKRLASNEEPFSCSVWVFRRVLPPFHTMVFTFIFVWSVG